MTTIEGALTYRQRIALRPGGSAKVELLDVSRQDAPASVLATCTIELGSQQVPIPFRLEVATQGLDPRGTFTLRAVIVAPDGSLAWTTDTVIPVDVTGPVDRSGTDESGTDRSGTDESGTDESVIDVGPVVLVPVSGATRRPRPTSPEGLVGVWEVVEIDGVEAIERAVPTISFDAHGRISGSTGCNSYSGSFAAHGEMVRIDEPLAVTRRACVPEIGHQETAFLAVVSAAATFAVVDGGAGLVLRGADGIGLSARRRPGRFAGVATR